MMKNLVFIFAGGNSIHAFDKLFSGHSAFDRCLLWGREVPEAIALVVAATKENEEKVKDSVRALGLSDVKIVVHECWNCSMLLEEMNSALSSSGADSVVYSSGDRPFIDMELTKEVLECHLNYVAEYTFADGYPYGFAPEVIDRGTVGILSSLAKTTQSALGIAPVSNECIFNVMKSDINSFEIEAVIAPKDYRLLRFDFSCSTKASTLACSRLFERALSMNASGAKNLSDIAEVSPEINVTLPAFYNVQICGRYNAVPSYNPWPKEKTIGDMSLEKFNGLVSQISEFSEDAVVSLSAWGEPLMHENFLQCVETVLSNRNLSVLVETNGLLVTEELALKVLDVSKKCGPRANGKKNIIWIVSVDAATEAMYSSIWTGGNFSASVNAVAVLSKYFEEVYPQFVRMNDNESELEAFYRSWHAKESPSHGKLIVQKYDNFCGLLENKKPADLSPLTRPVCWHLKRDVTILADGSVPACREEIDSNISGNVFEDGIEKIWNGNIESVKEHINKNYPEKCRLCDEYYTFNF